LQLATVLLFACPVLIGALLLYAASWARRKNTELIATGQTTREQALAAWRSGQVKRGFEIYYLGNLPSREAKVAKVLSLLVLVFVSAGLLVLLVALAGS
jgi:hypothetical protein